MSYILNIFICIVTPLVIAAICAGGRYVRFFSFSIAGIVACILSAYLNAFFGGLYGVGIVITSAEIAPVIEEIMKLLPVLFYLLVFEAKGRNVLLASLITATSFAVFENICYLAENGTENISYMLIRGFGAGAMHIVCGMLVGYGLAFTYEKTHIKLAGSCGLLGMAVTYHGVYNLLVLYGGDAQYIAYVFPILTGVLLILVRRLSASRGARCTTTQENCDS